jgi:bifunctional pyridoxal-dependent enzyme with beta-cystathionase and maltose regulon repressor activities
MNRILHEKSVLITPGAHFGIGSFLRIGFGYDAAKLHKGLKAMEPIIDELRRSKAA